MPRPKSGNKTLASTQRKRQPLPLPRSCCRRGSRCRFSGSSFSFIFVNLIKKASFVGAIKKGVLRFHLLGCKNDVFFRFPLPICDY